MGDFFKPWRRKAGCITLLMACVIAMGWIRSQTVADNLTYSTGHHSEVSWHSMAGVLCLQKSRIGTQEHPAETAAPEVPTRRTLELETDDPDSPTSINISETSWATPILISADRPFPTWETGLVGDLELSSMFEWRWLRLGFGIADLYCTGSVISGKRDVLSQTIYAIPYWSIVIPLTLLSAYLLLTNPRVTKPKTIVEIRSSE